MEIGILITAATNLENTISIYNKIMQDITPEFIWVGDRLLIDKISFKKDYTKTTDSPPVGLMEPFLAIARMAQERIRPKHFGISVTDLVRRSPVDIARSCFTINQWIGHPIHIGFGSGEAINLAPLGYQDNPKPVTHLKNQIEIFNTINQHGTYPSQEFGDIDLGYENNKNPVWIGGQRPRMLEIAAQHADGWIPAWKMSSSEYAEKSLLIRDMAQRYRRPTPKMGMFAIAMLGESKFAVLKEYENQSRKIDAVFASAEVWNRWGLQHPFGTTSKGFSEIIISRIDPDLLFEALKDVPDNYINDMAFTGSIDDVLSELWEFRKAGLQHIVLAAPLNQKKPVGYGLNESYSEFCKLCREIRTW